MKTHTVITLRDNSRHDTPKAALNHCQEQMGAELRAFVDSMVNQRPVGGLQRAMLEIVEDKKHDEAIKQYLEWRKEHDAITLWLTQPEEQEDDDDY